MRRRPRYFVARLPDSKPIEWDPPDPTAAVGYDLAYWGRALEAMERFLEEPDLEFMLVSAEAQVPWEGDKVVVVGIHVESWRGVAHASPRVRATFQAGGARPRPGGSLRGPVVPALTALALRGRTWARDIPRLASAVGARARDGRGSHPIFPIPVGCQSAPPPSQKPMGERPIALSFAGSINQWPGWWGKFTAKLGAPKTRSRRAMVRASERLRRSRPDLPIDIRLFDVFVDFSPGTGSYDDQVSQSYGELLGDSKICLVPGGTFTQTFRHFEAIRAGCAIVTDVPLDAWYVRDAPFIKVASWDHLEEAVLPLVADEAELERCHQAALRCWQRRCSEEAVGRFMAERLNELSRRS